MTRNDLNQDYRPIYMVIVYAATAIFTLLFSLYHCFIVGGSWTISLTLFLTCLCSLLAFWGSYKGSPDNYTNIFALIFITLGIAFAIAELGVRGMMFCYLTLLIYYFFLPFQRALLASILAISLYTWSASFQFEATLVLRFALTLLLTSSFVAIYAHAVQGQRQQLKTIAITDALTGALNRHSFYLELDKALNQVRRHNTKFSLIVFDVDHFKRLNDNHGHLVGDRVLVEITALVKSRLRQEDILFRYGGEEFAIILPFTDGLAAQRLAEELRSRVEVQLFSHQQNVTLSLGLATALPQDTASTWLRRTDELMYEAKRAGRNCLKVG